MSETYGFVDINRNNTCDDNYNNYTGLAKFYPVKDKRVEIKCPFGKELKKYERFLYKKEHDNTNLYVPTCNTCNLIKKYPLFRKANDEEINKSDTLLGGKRSTRSIRHNKRSKQSRRVGRKLGRKLGRRSTTSH